MDIVKMWEAALRRGGFRVTRCKPIDSLDELPPEFRDMSLLKRKVHGLGNGEAPGSNRRKRPRKRRH